MQKSVCEKIAITTTEINPQSRDSFVCRSLHSNSGYFLYGVNKIVLCKNGEVNKSNFKAIEGRANNEWES